MKLFKSIEIGLKPKILINSAIKIILKLKEFNLNFYLNLMKKCFIFLKKKQILVIIIYDNNM